MAFQSRIIQATFFARRTGFLRLVAAALRRFGNLTMSAMASCGK
jgi:hypothetical protein